MYLDNFIPFSMNKPLLLLGLVAAMSGSRETIIEETDITNSTEGATSYISVTMNVYTHIGFDDAEEELKRMEEFRKAQAEVEQKKEKPMSQKMFKVV